MGALDDLDDELAALAAAGLERSLRRVSGAPGAVVELDGRSVINFASNSYLGLANHPALVAAARDAAERCGTGSSASRLIVGNLGEHEELERDVARFHGGEAALLFNSGYHANLGVVTALAGPEDLVVSDALNHASLIDGCRLSRARVEVYRHGDAGHAAELLAGPARRRLLLTESLFSMDGDVAPLADLADAAARAGAALVIDEAHAVGARGPGGRGLCAEAGIQPEVLVGTFGKAFGSFGGYVVAEPRVRRWLISRARTFVFTTGLPAPVAAASRAALALAAGPEGDRRRADLAAIVARLTAGLGTLPPSKSGGWRQTGAVSSHILPVRVDDDRRVMAVTAQLLDAGLYVQGIRPPTVPRGTARLRIGAAADHTADQVDRLLGALRTALA